MKTKAIIILSFLLLGTQLKSQNTLVSVSTHDTLNHDVFILTDINLVGGDPDDRQSLIHLLWYADQLNIKAIVPDYWSGKNSTTPYLILTKNIAKTSSRRSMSSLPLQKRRRVFLPHS